MIAVLLTALGLFAFGPSDLQAPALIVGLILLVGMVGGVPLAGAGGWRNVSRGRRAVFHPIETQEIAASAADRQAEDELWRKERERYAQDERSS